MKIKNISIYGLFGEYDYELCIEGESLTYVHSKNGFGKSTVMKLINNVFSGDLAEVADTLFDRMDVSFDNDTALIIENRADGLLVQMQRNELEEEISPEELPKVLNVTYISPERLVVPKGECYVQATTVYLLDLQADIRKAMDDNGLVKVRRSGKDPSDAELEQKFKDIKAKLEFIKQAGFEPDMPPGFRFPPTRYEIMERKKEYSDFAASLEEYAVRNYMLAESAVVYMDIVNNIFENKTVFINDSGFLTAKMDREGILLPVEKLSSGEKQILVMFFRLLFQTKPGSLVIIDEPEMSLHISWQQQIGRYFKDVAKLRDLQMIVATHSPQIIHDDWEMAVELKVKDD